MIKTGIIRRIDDLGRVIIPKEIRRTTGIKENDVLEIFTTQDGQVILKKYIPDTIQDITNQIKSIFKDMDYEEIQQAKEELRKLLK